MAVIKVLFNGRVTDIVFPDVEHSDDVTGHMLKNEIFERTGIAPCYQYISYESLFGGCELEDFDASFGEILAMETGSPFTLSLRGIDPGEVMNYIPDEAVESNPVVVGTMTEMPPVSRAPPLEATITERVTIDGSCGVENVASRLLGKDFSSVFTCVWGSVDVGSGQLQRVFPFHFRTVGGCDAARSWSASLRELLVAGIHPAVLGRDGYEAAVNVLSGGGTSSRPPAAWNLNVSTSTRPPLPNDILVSKC